MNPENIIEACERAYGLPQGVIMEHQRTKTVSLARNVAMYLTRYYTDASYPEIGAQFKRHHTSVVKGVQRVKKLTSTNLSAAAQVITIMGNLEKEWL